jgi:hypothetical protein
MRCARIGWTIALLPLLAGAADNAAMALRPDMFYSSDADGNETQKIGLGWDWRHMDREHWLGLDVQHARFSGDGWSHEEQRVYGHAAGTFGKQVSDDTWRWQFKLGSNGDTALGSASLHTEGPQRREIFFERERLETEAAVARNQMHNFLGAAIDLPFTSHLSSTLLGGYQTFGDGNERVHARANLVFVTVPSIGFSTQLRTRYYHDSEPYTGGYYSPPWYGEALGVLAIRRVIGGYSWRGAVGFGRQRSADEDWKRARLMEFSFETPRRYQSSLRLNLGYTDTPVISDVGSSTNYSYRYVSIEAVIVF